MNGNDAEIKQPLVSVIMNCYNGQTYLKEAIDSVYAQSYLNWEIIFWDNCSTDRSADIAKSYGEKLKYYRSLENKPLGEARNNAMQVAMGKYIAFLDVDDIWQPDKLRQQVSLMEQDDDIALCYGSVEEIDEKGNHFKFFLVKNKTGHLLENLLIQFDIHIIACLIRRDALKKDGLNFDTNLTASEEYCLFMQLALSNKIGVVPGIIAKYRVHKQSLTTRASEILGQERRYTLGLLAIKLGSDIYKYKAAFKEAYSRSYYYDAKWYMANNARYKARRAMLKTNLFNFRYLFLFLLTFFPSGLWNAIHIQLKNRA